MGETVKYEIPALGKTAIGALNQLVEAEGVSTIEGLDLVVLIRRTEAFAAGMINNVLRASANAGFKELVADAKDPDKKSWDILDATVKRYTPKCSWAYSKEVAKMADALKAQQKLEQANGVAKKTDPVLDPTQKFMFSVSVTD